MQCSKRSVPQESRRAGDRPVAPAPSRRARSTGTHAVGSQGRHVRVLVVEDDPSIRAVLTEVLEFRGHEVCAVGDGMGGWEEYERDRFPLVLLDWSLPGIDGLELLRRVRGTPDGDSTIIV